MILAADVANVSILDCAVQIPNTVNRVEHPLVVLFMPVKHSLSWHLGWLRGCTTSCHPWWKSCTFDKNKGGKIILTKTKNESIRCSYIAKKNPFFSTERLFSQCFSLKRRNLWEISPSPVHKRISVQMTERKVNESPFFLTVHFSSQSQTTLKIFYIGKR